MYVFVRSLSINKMGALLSALIFTYNGFFMAHLYAGHLTFVQNYVWIPLIFFYLHRFMNTLQPKHAILSGLFLGVQILGGFPQIAFYTILAALLYALYSICTRLRRERGYYAPKAALGSIAILLIGFSLAALQLLPTFEFTQLSTRAGGTSYEFATLDSFPLKNFITFLIPDLYGIPADRTFWISDANWEFWEYCGYAGICALILTVIGIRRILTNRVGSFFVLLLVIALFLSLGKHNPLYRFIYYLPGFHHFRIPAHSMFSHYPYWLAWVWIT
jgi:drug/metabolite transporter (DMT)-like permease